MKRVYLMDACDTDGNEFEALAVWDAETGFLQQVLRQEDLADEPDLFTVEQEAIATECAERYRRGDAGFDDSILDVPQPGDIVRPTHNGETATGRVLDYSSQRGEVVAIWYDGEVRASVQWEDSAFAAYYGKHVPAKLLTQVAASIVECKPA